MAARREVPSTRRHHLFPGGDERIRTADPLLARQVLSQLSYTPGFGSLVVGRLSLGPLLEFASGEFLLFPTTNHQPFLLFVVCR